MLADVFHRRVKGFTLIELMIGLAIMGIVMMLAMPSFRAWMMNTRLRNAAESVLSGIQLARLEAVSRNAPVQFAFTTGSGWTVGCVTPAAPTCPGVIQARSQGDGSSSAVTIVSAPAAPTIEFDGLGRMTKPALGGAPSLAINVDLASTALSAADSRDLRITATAGGNVRLCDPNVSTNGDSRKC